MRQRPVRRGVARKPRLEGHAGVPEPESVVVQRLWLEGLGDNLELVQLKGLGVLGLVSALVLTLTQAVSLGKLMAFSTSHDAGS